LNHAGRVFLPGAGPRFGIEKYLLLLGGGKEGKPNGGLRTYSTDPGKKYSGRSNLTSEGKRGGEGKQIRMDHRCEKNRASFRERKPRLERGCMTNAHSKESHN